MFASAILVSPSKIFAPARLKRAFVSAFLHNDLTDQIDKEGVFIVPSSKGAPSR
jgi:hypothetical protein